MNQDFDTLVRRMLDAMDVMPHLPPGSEVYAACSGGADSVALVALLAAQSSYPLSGVLYVDHGQRDGAEELKSAKWSAERAGVSFKCLTLELAPGANLQARARDARYAALERCTPRNAYIATGHTLSDQAETTLQRVLRGECGRQPPRV